MDRVPIQVHLVAPTLVCWGLQRLVQTAGIPFVLTGCSATLAEAWTSLEHQLPDVLVLDFDDNYTLADVQSLYNRVRVKVLVLTSHCEDTFPADVLAAGARGVLQKREAPSALLNALEAVGDGSIFATPGTTERMFAAAVRSLPRAQEQPTDLLATLTWRERQTMAAVTADAAAPVKVIASRLCISEHTLRNHLTSIYSKMGVSGRLELYALAAQHGLSQALHLGRDAK